MHRRVLGPVVAACLALAGLTLLAPVPGLLAPARAASTADVDAAVDRAVGWLAQRQLADGSFGVNSGLDPAWALPGIAGAGIHPADLRPLGGGSTAPSAQDGQLAIWTLADPADWWAFSSPQATDWERALLQAHAAGLQPTRLSAQRNLLAGLAAYYRDGWFSSQTSVFNHTIFGLLALSTLPLPQALLDRSASVVALNQHDDGGYTSYPATDPAVRARASDVDSTGAAIAALCAAGRTPADPAVAGGIAFLRSVRSPDGAIGNVNSTSWALDGFGECGLRRGGAGWTAADETTVDWLLAGQTTSGADAGAWAYGGTANEYATADALRALSAAAFVVDPPARADAADPRVRPAPAVGDGTVVPVALAIDAGRGTPRLCATQAPVGATVAAVLEAARAASEPAGCVTALTLGGDGVVERIDGAAGGGWRARLDGGAESAAGPQAVGFGQVVALRLDDPDPVAFDADRLDFGEQPTGLLGGARRLLLRNAGAAAVTVRTLRIAGADGGDFAISSQECGGETLAAGESCPLAVRFAPSAAGPRGALLSATVDGSGRAPGVALVGSGGSLPAGPPGEPGLPGVPGAGGGAGGDGAAGAQGSTGPAGAAGARGATGRRGRQGPAGRTRRASCRLSGGARQRQRLRCQVVTVVGASRASASAPARLSRSGRIRARGPLAAMRVSGGRLGAGRYRLAVRQRGRWLSTPVRISSTSDHTAAR